MSMAIAYFVMYTVIGATIFFGLSMSQRISEDENGIWLRAFITSIVIDLAIVEFIMIVVSSFLLKKIGSHPAAMGPMRNWVLRLGPRCIRDAQVGVADNIKQIEKKPPENRRVHREKPQK
jgi:hypothetical protein